MEAVSVRVVPFLSYIFRPGKMLLALFRLFLPLFPFFFCVSCLFGCFLVGRWVHRKRHWARCWSIIYRESSLNNHKVSNFVLGRRSCVLIHESRWLQRSYRESGSLSTLLEFLEKLDSIQKSMYQHVAGAHLLSEPLLPFAGLKKFNKNYGLKMNAHTDLSAACYKFPFISLLPI